MTLIDKIIDETDLRKVKIDLKNKRIMYKGKDLLKNNELKLMNFEVTAENFYNKLKELFDLYDDTYYPYKRKHLNFPIKENVCVSGHNFDLIRVQLECFILFSSLLIDIPWEDETKFFIKYKNHVIYKEWIKNGR